MLRSIVFVFLFIFSVLSLVGQKTSSVQREFSYTVLTLESGQGAIEGGFAPNFGYFDDAKMQPVISFTIPTSFENVSFTVISYESEELSAVEIKMIDQNFISESVIPKAKVIGQRFQKFAAIEMNAVFRNKQTGRLEKITKIDGELKSIPNLNNKPKSFVNSSVLSSGSGSWYRIAVEKEGLYKIDHNFLVNNGINTQGLNTQNIAIYGNDQGMMSHQNNVYKVDDLKKKSVDYFDGGDGKFDAGDYLVFYAKGPHDFYVNGPEWLHTRNCYTDSAYYFINISNSPNAQFIGNSQLSSGATTHTVTKFNDFQFLEEDERNLAKSGTEWLGDIFDVQLSKNYSFSFPNIVSSDSIIIRTNIGISSPVTNGSTCEFVVSSNGTSLSLKPGGGAGSGQGTTSPKCRFFNSFFKVLPNGDDVNISLVFNKGGLPSSIGYLDYFQINAIRNLTMEGSQMKFSHLASVGFGNVAEFVLSNANNVESVWEITDATEPRKVNFTRNGSSLTFKVDTDTLRHFIAFTGSQFFSPSFVGEVPNQNLHGLEARDMLIIAAPEFYPAAMRIADFHSTEGLSSHLVNQQEIFNEFSSGMRDPVAIKQFLKMFYDRANGDPNLLPKFCLIVGDCSYDYRNRLNSKSDFVITYESTESMAASTFSTDDFYVILDDNEGMNGSDLMDMAIGRLPVQTLQEAEGVVDKIIAYSSKNANELNTNIQCAEAGGNEPLRDWRNIVAIVSDDGDNNAYFYDVENMATIIEGTHPELNIITLHSDAYQETVTPGGERNEGVEEAIRSRVQRGALLVNYIGHGGELGWAHEEILNVPTIKDWSNLPKLPIFMTATCEFSRYDDHDRVSAGEYVVLNENGGAVALFTTTRLVFTTDNRRLAEVFYDTVADKISNKAQYIGDVYKGAKNKFAINFGSNEARKFTFLGDPAVRLAIPSWDVIADSINGVELTLFNDTLKALSEVTISGHIEDDNGNQLTNFNGLVFPTIYDKISQLSTLANTLGSSPLDFDMWKNIVYKGKATVKNGKFIFTFIVPQDISYNYGPARLSFYAENGENDANGVNESPLMGGINTNAPADGIGPTVQLYMNTEQFVNGGITNTSPILLAKVFDENGINMVGNGIGHNIEIRLDDDTEPIILNDYYESDVDTYKSGEVRFQLTDIEPGVHVLKFKVWDVYNNSSDAELEFTVVEDEEINIKHLLNYPNPFTTNTEFSFEHNQVCDFLDIQIQVFTITGKMVKNISQRVHSEGFRVSGINWDGRDEFGDRIGIGTYVYKITVVNEAGAKLEKFEKLVILN